MTFNKYINNKNLWMKFIKKIFNIKQSIIIVKSQILFLNKKIKNLIITKKIRHKMHFNLNKIFNLCKINLDLIRNKIINRKIILKIKKKKF